jgi:hypothetical protein
LGKSASEVVMAPTRKQAKDAYDNPPIAAKLPERCAAALTYFDEERNGWGKKMICKKAGICLSTFNKALRARGDPSKPAPKGKGQQPLLSETVLARLVEEVTRTSFRFGAPESTMQFVGMLKQVMREEAGNDFLDWDFSDSWLQKLKQQFLTVERASQKSPDRVRALETLRNSLSLAATLWWMIRDGLQEELFYSSDDVSVLLNKMNDKPKVITTKAAKAVMEKQGLAISATTTTEKQRVVTFNITISGGGSLVCKVLKFADRDFTQFAEKPFVVCMDEDSDAERMFVMLYQYGMEDAKVEEAMYRKCILPEVEFHRYQILKRNERRLEEIQTSQSQSQTQSKGGPHSKSQAQFQQQQSEGEDEEVEGEDEHEMEVEEGGGEGEPGNGSDVEDEYVIDPALEAVLPEVQEEGAEGPQRFRNCAAMFCDGAFGQIAALRLAISRRIETKLMAILLGKYAGGCSMTQSGNDNGQMHLTVHGSFKSPSFRYGKVKDRPGPTWKDLKVLMQQSIDSASFKSVWKCMGSSQDFLIKAFTPSSIKSAFRKTGVVPFAPHIMLSKCPHFRELKTAEAKRVLMSIDTFADLVEGADDTENGGQVPEDEYRDILGSTIDNAEEKTGKPLNERGMNAQRALVINHPNMLYRYANKDLADKAAKAEKAERKKRKADSAAGIKIEGDEDQQPSKKPKIAKVPVCSNPCCLKSMPSEDIFDNTSSSSSSTAKVWARCGRSRCPCLFCPNCGVRALEAHRNVCDKPEKKVTRKLAKR